jgi:hypothetical protein
MFILYLFCNIFVISLSGLFLYFSFLASTAAQEIAFNQKFLAIHSAIWLLQTFALHTKRIIIYNFNLSKILFQYFKTLAHLLTVDVDVFNFLAISLCDNHFFKRFIICSLS